MVPATATAKRIVKLPVARAWFIFYLLRPMGWIRLLVIAGRRGLWLKTAEATLAIRFYKTTDFRIREEIETLSSVCRLTQAGSQSHSLFERIDHDGGHEPRTYFDLV
jgi:hypothetical protein